MNERFDARFTRYLKDRKTLLWIVNEKTNPEGIVDESIKLLAELFWEACWTESVTDYFFDVSSVLAQESPRLPERGILPRTPYRFSASPDRIGQIDRHIFLPIYEINGSSRSDESEGWFKAPGVRRSFYRLNQMRKLEDFAGYSLLVVGAEKESDLDTLKEALEFSPIGMDVFLLLAKTTSFVGKQEFPRRANVHIINEDIQEFINELKRSKVPVAASFVRTGIRYGSTQVEVSESEFGALLDQFVLIKARDLEAQKSITLSLLEQFQVLRTSEDKWEPFANGLVFERHYVANPETEDKLPQYLLNQLDELSSTETDNLTIQIPATSGSGITTSLRSAAFQAAASGYPTLICRSNCLAFSIERIHSFLTTIHERSTLEEEVPALIIFDREHHSLEDCTSLASNLNARGRSVIVVRVIPPTFQRQQDPERDVRPSGRYRMLAPFKGAVDNSEIRALCSHFQNIFSREGGPAPSLQDWEEWEQRNASSALVGVSQVESLFWVALQYFIKTRNPEFDISGWILRVCNQNISDEKSRRALRSVAAFSCYGIPVPLTPLMRSLGTGNIYDTEVFSVFDYLATQEEVLEWYPIESEMQDQAIGFRHRLIASRLMDGLNVLNWQDPLEECKQVLSVLQPSSEADSWLVETLVFDALRPNRGLNETQGRLNRIIDTYNKIPSVLAERSQAIQHHWGRALHLLARDSQDVDKQLRLFTESIGKLLAAAQLSGKFKSRENPRNVLNTLGTVRAELSEYYRQLGSEKQSEQAWQDAADAFDQALSYGADNYVTLSAFAKRLIDHGQANKANPEQLTKDMTLALTLIVRALELPGIPPEDEDYLRMCQYNAYKGLNDEKANAYKEGLQKINPELWAILSTHEILRRVTNEDWAKGDSQEILKAFNILDSIYSNPSYRGNWHLLYLLYKVASSLKTHRYNFQYRLGLLDRLSTTQFRWDPKTRFTHCVLCYQAGEYTRGTSLFRTLRTMFNTGQLELRHLVSFLRDPKKPELPRLATIKVTRVDSPWRAYGEVIEMDGQNILMRPRYFDEPPKIHEIRQCYVTFESFGPIAIPPKRRPHSIID